MKSAVELLVKLLIEREDFLRRPENSAIRSLCTSASFEDSALRARLAECEAVMEQAIYAIRSGGERHLFADESEAIELYETYKSSHEVKK